METVVAVLAVGALLGNAAAAAWVFESVAPTAVALRRSMRRRSAWAVAVPVAGAALALGVPYAYVQTTDDAPEPLQFSDAPMVTSSSSTTSTSTRVAPVTGGLAPGSTGSTLRLAAPLVPPTGAPPTEGTAGEVEEATSTTHALSEVTGRWAVGQGSIAGYRAQEVLVLQSKTTVGRTSNVTGAMSIDDLTVSDASFTVDMASVTSDNPQRDEQYRTRIMDTNRYPTSHFVLTEPIVLEGLPSEDEVIEVPATGDLTIRGVTRSETFTVQARRHAGRIEVLGQVPIVWADYGIPDPSAPLMQVEDHGLMEFLLLFDRAA